METNLKLEVIRSQTAKLIEAVEPRNEAGVSFTPEEHIEIPTEGEDEREENL